MFVNDFLFKILKIFIDLKHGRTFIAAIFGTVERRNGRSSIEHHFVVR